MKKTCLIFAIFLLFTFVSCGNSKSDNKNDEPDTGEAVTDGDTYSTDTEPADTMPDDISDTDELGELTCRKDEDQEYSFLSFPNNDFTRYEICKAGCDQSTGKCKSWKDPYTGIVWSHLKLGKYDPHWDEAVSYCDNLSLDGYDDWSLPTVNDLRTLIINCPGTETGGECKIGEGDGLSCNSSDWTSACGGCGADNGTGIHNKFGRITTGDLVFWSSSIVSGSGTMAWVVNLSSAKIYNERTNWHSFVRCVRYSMNEAEKCEAAGGSWNEAENTCTKTTNCTDLPENAEWNGDDSYTQTFTGGIWNGEISTEFNEEAGTCHFKCKENYFFNSNKCLNPCDSNPCDSLEAITDRTCVAYDYKQYSCGGKDPSSGLTWSAKAQQAMNWDNAGTYCGNLSEDGHTDWRLPTINELRTLIQNCSKNEMPNGSCAVNDPDCLALSCWTSETCGSCLDSNNKGPYSKFGDTDQSWWSSSNNTDDTNYAWIVDFYRGSVRRHKKTYDSFARCVRNAD